MVTNKAQETFAQHHRPGFIVFIVPWRCWWVHWGEEGSTFISFQCRAGCGTLFDFDEKLWLGWYNIFAWLHVLVQAPLLYNIICIYIYLFWFCISVHICWNIFWICLKVLHLIHTHTHTNTSLYGSILFDSIHFSSGNGWNAQTNRYNFRIMKKKKKKLHSFHIAIICSCCIRFHFV